MVDAAEGVLGIEWIDGKSVRFLLGSGEEHQDIIEEGDVEEAEPEDVAEEDPLSEYDVSKGEDSVSYSHLCLPCRRRGNADDWH